MREEPIISGAVIKAALVILVAGALGVGAYALVGGEIDIDLPDVDLPEIDTTTGEDATALQDTTIDEGSSGEEPAADPFTSAGFATALGKVREEVGEQAQLTRLFINEVQTQFIVRRGDEVEAYSVGSDSGEVSREEATVTITGNATIADFAYPLSAVRPGAVDRILAAARRLSGAQDLRPTVLTLERRIPFGSRELGWSISAEGGGRNLTFRAGPDGKGVTNVGGEGTPIPPAAQNARKLNECIQAAENDPEEIFACLERF